MRRLVAFLILVALHQLVNTSEPFGMYPEEDSSLKFVDASGPPEILRWLLYRICFSDPQYRPKFMQSPARIAEFFQSFSESNADQLLREAWTVVGMEQKPYGNFRVCNLNPHKLQEEFVEGEPEPEAPTIKCVQHVQMNDHQEEQLRNIFNC